MIIYDMPESEYHAHPALSSTGVKKILELPALFKHEILDGNRDHKDAFDFGSAVHAKVLGVGWGIKELEFDNYRTKAAQTARDDARAEGLIPMLAHELKHVHECAESVLKHPMARALLELEGAPEVSVFARDEEAGVDLRCRFDYFPKDHAAVVDLKTAENASPRVFKASIAKWKYHVSEAHYLDTLKFATGEDRRMVFIAVEKTAPYLVAVHQVDSDFLEAGRVEARKARDTFRRCMDTGEWPGYPENINLLSMPNWAFWEHNEDYGE